MIGMKAYILLKTTENGSFMACVVASTPSEAITSIKKDMDIAKYREIGYDDVLKDSWIVTPPDRLTEVDLIEVPAGKVFGFAIDNSKCVH